MSSPHDPTMSAVGQQQLTIFFHLVFEERRYLMRPEFEEGWRDTQSIAAQADETETIPIGDAKRFRTDVSPSRKREGSSLHCLRCLVQGKAQLPTRQIGRQAGEAIAPANQ